MSYCNNRNECSANNCKCHDIHKFLESVLQLNHALSEAIHAELVAIREIKNVVSSEFLMYLKKDLNNTLKLAMNKDVLIEMLLDEVRDHCEIIFYETECNCEKKQVDVHKEARCEECENEKDEQNSIVFETSEVSHPKNNKKEKSIITEVNPDECEKNPEVKEEHNSQEKVPKEKEKDKKEKQKKEEEKKIKVEKHGNEKKEPKEGKEEKSSKKETENKNPYEQKKEKEHKMFDYDNYEENEEEDETYIIIRSRRR